MTVRVLAIREVAGGGQYLHPELGARLVVAEAAAVRHAKEDPLAGAQNAATDSRPGIYLRETALGRRGRACRHPPRRLASDRDAPRPPSPRAEHSRPRRRRWPASPNPGFAVPLGQLGNCPYGRSGLAPMTRREDVETIG
jgi:hypothetical protein